MIDKEKLTSSSYKKNLDTLNSEKRKISNFFHGFSVNPLKESVLTVVRVRFGVGFRYFILDWGGDQLFIPVGFEAGSKAVRHEIGQDIRFTRLGEKMA